MIRSRFFWKIFLSYLAVIAVTSVTISYLMTLRTEQFVKSDIDDTLRDKLALVQLILEHEDFDRLSKDDLQAEIRELSAMARTRISLVADDGTVLAESDVADPSEMGNHADRPEIVEAREKAFGRASRPSATMGQEMLYEAKRATVGGNELFLRVGLPVSAIRDRWHATRDIVLIGAVLATLVSVLLALFLASRVTGPVSDIMAVAEAISHGNYDARVMKMPQNEIGTLGRAINTLAEAVQTNINRREQVERIRREFSSNASHELKTPLTSIKGYVETLLGGAIYDKDNNVRFLQIIKGNIDRMILLVNDLLRISGIEANQDLLELGPVDWSTVIDEVVSRHEINLKKKHITLNRLWSQRTMRVRGNAKAMSHVIDNLLQNAINYTPEGGAISISLIAGETNGLLQVKDTGIGIAKPDQSRIFERFYRVDHSRSRDDGGTGLGLAIVKHLVLQMHGTIKVESELGQGSVFSVTLPLFRRNA